MIPIESCKSGRLVDRQSGRPGKPDRGEARAQLFPGVLKRAMVGCEGSNAIAHGGAVAVLDARQKGRKQANLLFVSMAIDLATKTFSHAPCRSSCVLAHAPFGQIPGKAQESRE